MPDLLENLDDGEEDLPQLRGGDVGYPLHCSGENSGASVSAVQEFRLRVQRVSGVSDEERARGGALSSPPLQVRGTQLRFRRPEAFTDAAL